VKYFSILVAFLMLVACANTGNESMKGMTEDKVQATIVAGKTTKAQIQGMFGSPFETSYTDNGALIWKYQYDDTTAFTPETVGSVIFTLGLAGTKSEGTRNELVILFDENDVVRKFNMSNSDIETGTLLFAN
jgi:outer membrane protein assembly factor BamE (lipoprotein component of BamABCDE complex)